MRRFCEDHTRLALVLVLGLALALRGFALWTLSRSIYYANLMPDEQVYDAWARLLLEGKPLPYVYDFPSAPAYVFATLYRVFGTSSGVIRGFDLVLGTATCGALFVAGMRVGGRCTGVVSALLAAVYGPFVLFSITAHHTALGLFAFACLLAAAALCFERPSLPRIAGVGAAIAITTWLRPNSIALAAVVFGWLLVTAWRARAPLATWTAQVAALTVGLGLLFVPGVGGVPEPAFNLYLANTLDNPTPYFRPVRFASSEPSQQAMGFVVEASVRSGQALSLEQAHDYWIAALAEEWRDHPGAALAKVATKIGATLHPYEAANNHNLAFLARYVSGLALPYANFAFVFALAVIAVPRVRRGNAAARGLAVLALGYACTLLLFFADSRIRAPFALALMPFAALGIETLLEAVSDRRRFVGLSLTAAAVFGALYALPVPGAGDLSTAYNFHALFLFDSGDLDQAAAFYRESAELDGTDSESAYLGLSAIAARQGDMPAAERDLSLISDAHYKAAEKYLQLGSLLTRTHRFGPAAEAFQHSLQINPSQLELYPLLIALLERRRDLNAAAEVKRKYTFVTALYE